MEESPLANPPANPPPSRTHTHSAWHPTWGLLSLSTLPAWGGPPLGDPQSPHHLSFQTAGLVGTPLLALGWALAATVTLINQGAEGVSEMGLWNVWTRGVPLTLRRTRCGAVGAGLPGSEDTGDELVENTGSFVPEQRLAAKRLLPSPDGG